MQEGITSLMQMSKTSAALKKHSDAGLLYISVSDRSLRTGGRLRPALAMLGDVMTGGAGSPDRICRSQSDRADNSPEASQRLPESRISPGAWIVDEIVERENLKRTLTKLLKLHGRKRKTEGTDLPGSDKVQEINDRSAAEVKLSDNVGTADREKHIFHRRPQTHFVKKSLPEQQDGTYGMGACSDFQETGETFGQQLH